MIEKKKERKVQEWKQSGTPSKIPSKLFDVVLYIEKGGTYLFLENGNSILTVFLSEFLKKKDTFNNSLSKGILICSQICWPSNLKLQLSIGFFKI